MTRGQKNKLCERIVDITQHLLLISYWVFSTFYMFHNAFKDEDRNVMFFIMSAIIGWAMTPFIFILNTCMYLSTVHLNW